MSGLMPWYILREWDNSGKLLSGGLLYFYDSGTTTPKAVYSDHTLTVPLTNPVVLDPGGAADIFLGDGAYRILIKDSHGVQIREPIDGIQGLSSGLSEGSNISMAAVKVYNDVRALTASPDFVYVSGAEAEGDGGAGLFQLIPNSTLPDDDGIVLTSGGGTRVYVRVFDGPIDPRWYGLDYGVNVDQTAAFNKVTAASATHNRDALFAGESFYTQNTTVNAGASIRCNLDSFFHAGSGLTMTFKTGSRFSAEGISFGANIQPVFEADVVSPVPLSWMGGQTNEEKIAKLAACAASGVDQVVLIDTSYTVSSIPTFPANYHVDVAGGLITTTGAATALSMDVIYAGDSQFISYSNVLANVGATYVGKRPARPEWFGAKGDNTTDDAVAFQACFKHGDALLMNKSYRLARKIDTTRLTIRGELVASMAVNAPMTSVSDVPTPRLYMDPATHLEVVNFTAAGQFSANGVGLAMTNNAIIETKTGGNIHLDNCVVWGTSNSLKSTWLVANDTAIGNASMVLASVANQNLTNVRFDNDYTKRFYRNNSSFQDMFLENEVNSASYDNILTTDSTGKVVGKSDLEFQSLDINGRLTTHYLLEEGIEVTNVRFHWYAAGGTPHCDVYRDDVIVDTFANDPAYYTMQASDSPTLLVTSDGYDSSWPSMSILPSAVKPSNSARSTIVYKTPSQGALYIGEVTPLHMHNATRLVLPSLINFGIIGFGVWVGDNWAFTV